MERTKYLYLVLLYTLCLTLLGQHNRSIYNAYLSGDMTQWKQTLDSLEQQPLLTQTGVLELINYYYGYAGWCVGQERDDEAKQYIKQSEKLINDLMQKEYQPSLLYAYKAALVGFNIGLAPYKAPFIGPQSSTYAEQSVALDSLNPMAYIQLGNIAFYKPSMFGGSKSEAMEHYLKALSIMERVNTKLSQDWNYLSLLATIINAYIELEEYQNARAYCIKTMTIAPKFKWVKEKLYPKVLKNL